MRPESIVLLPPPFDNYPGLLKRVEYLPTEYLISELFRDTKAKADPLYIFSLRKPYFSFSQHTDDLFRAELF